MTTTPELVAAVMLERDRQVRGDRLARLVADVLRCCNPSLIVRLARALRPAAL